MINALISRFGLPLAAWALFFHESITDMVGVWGQSKTYEHGYLIVPICLWLVWQEKERFQTERLSTTWLPAALLVVPGLLWLIGNTAGIAFFEHVAAVISLQLIIWALIGHSVAKTFYFPILYLFFCIPFGEELVPYLQSITADLSVAMVKLSDIPIYREGMYLYIPNGQFEVAEACSGIRFLISSIALGSLFGYLFFNKIWKLIAFVAFSCILPIIANSLRAYGIILVGHLSNMEHATGADHLVYGWVFFSVVTLINFSIAYSLRDKKNNNEIHFSTPTNKNKHNHTIISVFILILLLSINLWEKVGISSEQQAISSIKLSKQVTTIDQSTWGIMFPKASKSVLVRMKNKPVEIFKAKYNLSLPGSEIISSQNSLYDKTYWSIIKSSSFLLNDINEATEISLINLYGEHRTLIYWYCINGNCSNNSLVIKLRKAYYLLTKQNANAEVIAISSEKLSFDELQEVALSWQHAYMDM